MRCCGDCVQDEELGGWRGGVDIADDDPVDDEGNSVDQVVERWRLRYLEVTETNCAEM